MTAPLTVTSTPLTFTTTSLKVPVILFKLNNSTAFISRSVDE